MSAPIEPGDVERFRSIVGLRLGLHLEETQAATLAEVLRGRVELNGRNRELYLDRLESEAPRHEIAALARELTVSETYFFRNVSQFRAFSEVVLPERTRGRAPGRRLRILSAGCASGEEAYSLAILVREAMADPSWDVSVLGVDVNPAMIQRALRARYSSWSLRETPPEIQRRWFRREGRDLVLNEEVCNAARFEERNLAEEDPSLWWPRSYDVVFCRNVIMYFTPETARAVIARISRSLAPGGFLFLGHAETLRGLSQDFDLVQAQEAHYYRRRDVASRYDLVVPELRAGAAKIVTPRPAALPFAARLDGSWVEAIRTSSERVRSLTSPAVPPGEERGEEAAAGASALTRRAPLDLGPAIDLLKQERFSEALVLLRALPPRSGRDTQAWLLRAVLLTHLGDVAGAERACAELLELDETNAAAHYLIALCRMDARDHRGAADHDRTASRLDPCFAMPRLHLGLLARRAGDRDAACRELQHALSLLQREDESRLLFFGGGFTRGALVDLCRAQLASCGRA